MTKSISDLYKECKQEVDEWLIKQEWWLPHQVISEFISKLSFLFTESEKWEKGYLYNVVKPRLKKDFETFGLPYLESLAEHYVDNCLPFQNELMEEIVNDNVKKIVDDIFEKLSQ